MTGSSRRELLWHAWAQAALWLCIALLANHLSSAMFVRVDLTSEGLYTLSTAAKSSVRRLDKPLVANVFISDGLEAPYNNHRQAVIEKLEELRAWSGGRLEIRYTDPSDDASQADAERFGIQPVQYRFRSSARQELKWVWLGVSLTYGNRREVVSPIAHLETLEYELVRAIRRVTTETDDRQIVGYTQGSGEPDLASFTDQKNPLHQLRKQIESTHDFVPVVLGADGGVPENIDALLVIGPQNPVSPRAQYQIDQFVMGGGPTAFFISTIRPDWRRYRASEVPHGMQAQLAHYGLSFGRSVLLDRQSNEKLPVYVRVGGQLQVAEVNHPMAIVSRNMSPSSPAVRGLDALILPFATAVSVAKDLPPERRGSVWAHTGAGAVTTDSFPSLDFKELAEPIDGEVAGPFPVAVAVSGVFDSWFAERPVPPPPGRTEALAEDDKIVAGVPGRIVAVGSADFVANNHAFVLNTVDWLLQDASLIEIRSRKVGFAELDAPDAAQAMPIKLGMAGLPFGLLILLSFLRVRGRQ